MHKLIHSNFEIDLSNYQLSIVEENHWFKDQFFTKYSYPFILKLTDNVADAFEKLYSYYSEDPDTIYELLYVLGDTLEKATLLIEQIEGNEISLMLRYGFDEFPNWNKKLSELDLEKFEITNGDIYSHAANIITQSWPDVNYNFPQVHTDKIDTTESIWTYFEKIINNYKDGAFLINEVIGEITYNRNLMQPLPYYLYILKKGFELGGFTLRGDILENDVLKKMVLYHENKYYNTNESQHYYISITHDDIISIDDRLAYYNKSVEITSPGKYHLDGMITIQSLWKRFCSVTIKYRETILWKRFIYDDRHHSGYPYTFYIDKEFETIQDGQPNILTIESHQYHMNPQIADVYADSILLYDDDGTAIPNVINLNEIDLNRVVPDKIFGEFVTTIKNWFNLDIDLRGSEVWMNYINSEITYSDAFDLSDFEVKHPTRSPQQNTSFLLKYADIESDEYSYDQMYYNNQGWATDNFVTDDETNEIVINALPLPLLERNGVQTAYSFESSDSKLYAVIYNGLNSQLLNLSEDITPLLIPNLAPIYWDKWLNFRVKSINFKWAFTTWIEKITGLKAKGKIFAYGNYFVVKLIEKTELKEDLFTVEIEAEKLS